MNFLATFLLVVAYSYSGFASEIGSSCEQEKMAGTIEVAKMFSETVPLSIQSSTLFQHRMSISIEKSLLKVGEDLATGV